MKCSHCADVRVECGEEDLSGAAVRQYCFEDDVDVLVELERVVTLTRSVLKGEPSLPMREFVHDIWFLYRLFTFSSMSHLISMLNPP